MAMGQVNQKFAAIMAGARLQSAWIQPRRACRPVVAPENSLCSNGKICGEAAALTRRKLLPFAAGEGNRPAQPGRPQIAQLCLAFGMEPVALA